MHRFESCQGRQQPPQECPVQDAFRQAEFPQVPADSRACPPDLDEAWTRIGSSLLLERTVWSGLDSQVRNGAGRPPANRSLGRLPSGQVIPSSESGISVVVHANVGGVVREVEIDHDLVAWHYVERV